MTYVDDGVSISSELTKYTDYYRRIEEERKIIDNHHEEVVEYLREKYPEDFV